MCSKIWIFFSCIVSCDNKEFDENCKRTPNPNNNIFVYWKSGISEKELKPREKSNMKESTSLIYLSDCENLTTSVCSIEIKANDDDDREVELIER